MILSFLYPIFPVSLLDRENVDDEGELVVRRRRVKWTVLSHPSMTSR
jgi:hypothetical protein